MLCLKNKKKKKKKHQTMRPLFHRVEALERMALQGDALPLIIIMKKERVWHVL
jgi:hypothetical protein